MNRNFALLMAATLALGSAAPAFAQDAAPSAPPATHGPAVGGPSHFFEDADTNKDGFLTKEEMRAAQDKKLDEMFAHLDTNHDGKLSKEELRQGHEEMRNKMRAKLQDKKAQSGAATTAPVTK
jgi:hypothetical protein